MFLDLPEDRAGRWRRLAEVLATWGRPLAEADRVPAAELDEAGRRLGVRIPPTLREWYLVAGGASDVWRGQDRFLTPAELVVRDGVLVFAVEAQGIWSMGVDLSDPGADDPPVVGWMNEAWADDVEFGPLDASTSGAALHYLAWTLASPAVRGFRLEPGARVRHGDAAWGPSALAVIERAYDRCPFPTWRLWGRDTVFLEGEDILIRVGIPTPPDDECRLDVAARSDPALARFEDVVRGTELGWDIRP